MRDSDRPLNIVVIDNAFYPLTYGYMQEIFGRCLPERGHNVTWLLMSADADKMGESRRLGPTDVVLAKMMNRQGRYATFVNYFYHKPRVARLLPLIAASSDIDVVFVRNHVRLGFSAYRFCRARNVPFVYYLGYPYLESHLLAARLGHRRPRCVAEAAAFVGVPLRNWITRSADFVFAMSEYWREQVIRELSIPSNRIQALPAGFNTSINPGEVDGTWVRKQFNLNNHPTLFYMGTITPPRDMSMLVDMMVNVVRQIPKARLLLLYGHGEERWVPILKQQFSEKGVGKNVVFAPPVPYHQVPDYIGAAHVGLSPIETIPLYNVSSPYKFAEMLGMACPVVASDTPDQSYVLNKSGGGICVPYDADAFAEAVVGILNNPDEAKEMGRCARAFIEKERSYDVLAKRIESVFFQLVEKQSPQ